MPESLYWRGGGLSSGQACCNILQLPSKGPSGDAASRCQAGGAGEYRGVRGGKWSEHTRVDVLQRTVGNVSAAVREQKRK